MNQWKILIQRIKEDYSRVRKDAHYFLAIFALLQAAGIGNLQLFTPGPFWQRSDFLALLGSITISILNLLNVYYFQRQYSKQLDVRVPIHSFTELLWNYIRIYVLQFLILLPIVLGLTLVMMLPIFLMTEGSMLYNIWMVITATIFALFTLYWVFRLFFLNYILLYHRTSYKMKWLVYESKYLIRSRLPIFLGMLLLTLLGSGSLIAYSPIHLQLHSIRTPWFIQLFSIACGMVIMYISCVLTVHAVKDERESFMLQSEA